MALALEDSPNVTDGGKLLFVQRLEVLHEGNVILYLLKVNHAGKHHHHACKTCRELQHISDRTAAVQFAQHGFCIASGK